MEHWLHTNAPYSPETMSIIQRSWRTIGEMASVMLIHSGLAEPFWEEATLYSVDIYNRVLPAKANRAGIRMSPYEKLHGLKPMLNDLRPFGCRGFALIPVQGKSHKSRSQQVMWMRKEFKTIGGARFYHPPTKSYGTSGHVKWYPGLWYDPKLTKFDISAQLMGEGTVEDYQYPVGTTHFDDEDGLLYVTQKVYEGSSML